MGAAEEKREQVSLEERCRRIELLILDVDGVLTDGRITYCTNDTEIKSFHVRDGSGLKVWQREGKRAAIITGRTSLVVDTRAKELGIDPVIQGSADKLESLRGILEATETQAEQVCCIGDDLPDLPLLANYGLAVTVADACPDVRSFVHHVTEKAGGQGAVREVIEMILHCQGTWGKWVAHYRDQQ